MVAGKAPALDFDKLWAEKYNGVVASIARNFSQVNEFQDPDYLASDIYWNCWRKAVTEKWPQYYAKSSAPDFDAWAMYIIKHYLIDQARKMRTTPQRMRQTAVPLDAPVKNSEGEEVTYDQLIGTTDKLFPVSEDEVEWNELMKKISDPQLKGALGVFRSNHLKYSEPSAKIWERVEKATGLSRTSLIRKLREEPALLEYLGL